MRLVFTFLMGLFVAVTPTVSAQMSLMVKTFQDSSRDREIAVDIFYPAGDIGVNLPVKGGPYPVVIFGHGMAMPVQSYRHLVLKLLEAHYIVALPKTEMGMSPDHDAYSRDLAFVAEAIISESEKSDSPLFRGVTPKFAAVGHSMGGGASFWAATVTDRFSTIVALAPAEFEPPPSVAAAKIDIPVLVITGDSDGVTSLDGHVFPIYEALDVPCKQLIAIKGGSHCGFSNPNWLCNAGENILAPSEFIDREKQHQITYDYLLPWLSYYLDHDCDVLSALSSDAMLDDRVVYQNDCESFISPCASIMSDEIRLSPDAERYSWLLNDEQLPGEQYESVSIAYGSGVYQCIAELYNGCVVESEPIWYHGDRVEARGKLKYRFYEHPGTGKHYFELFGLDLPIELHWYDAAGIELETITIHKNRQEIELPEESLGLNFFSLERESKALGAGKVFRD